MSKKQKEFDALVCICMSPKQKEQLTTAAKLQGLSISAFVRELFEIWLTYERDQNKKKR